MKLEMTVHGLMINLELDDSGYNGLEILQHVKDLVDELSAYDKVMLSVVSAPQQEEFEQDDESDEDYQEMSEEEHVAQAAWPFPIDGHVNQDGEIIDFIEPDHTPT